MTNKKAKDILDFIARRNGWTNMSMHKQVIYQNNDTFNFMLFIEGKSMLSPLWIDFIDKAKKSQIIAYKKKPSWLKVLNDIFKILNDKIVQKISDGCHDMFMHHGDTLESTLVEIDLHSNA